MLNHLLRYAPVVEIVEDIGPRTLLEVGSGSRGISRYLLTPVPTTACDVSFDDYGSSAAGDGSGVRRVTASVLDLPFPDASFDVVVALDLIEHLDPADRPRAIDELRRVAARALVAGCPTGPAALRADRRLAGYLRRWGRPLPGWLEEHLRFGFPSARDLSSWVGGTHRVLANERTATHALVCALEATPVLWTLPWLLERLLARQLGRRGVRSLVRGLRGGDTAPAYRTILVASPSRPRR